MSGAAAEGHEVPARIVARACLAPGTGIVHAARGKHRRLLCLRGGRLVFVASNVIEEQLEAALLKAGLLARRSIEALKAEATGSPGVTVAALLLRRSGLSRDELDRVAAERARALLFSTLEWPDGELRFEAGRPALEGELTVELDGLALVHEHARRHPAAIAEVRRRIGKPETRPIRSEHAEECLERLELDEVARRILEHSRGSLTVKELLARVAGTTEEVLRALHALMTVGVLRPALDAEIPRLDAAESISRAEVLGRVERVDGADHYAILGLTERADAEAVREAYYFLARRYHPDRFRAGHLADLLDRMEAYFSRVTEAYNTLSDAERRAAYDEERLAGSTASGEPAQDTAYLARQNYAKGKLLVDRKQFQDAVQFLENAIQLDSSKPLYHLELGRVLILNPRRRAEAEELLRTTIAMNPALIDAYLGLAELCARTSRPDEAVAALEEALRWDPGNAEATRRLEELGGGGRRKGRFG